MADIALRLDGVSRFYGKVRAVDDLSLTIPSGAFVTLLGPSGCGKSTTLADRRSRPPRRGPHPPRRRGHHRHAAQRAADGDGLPELRAVPAPVGVRQHRLRPEAAAPPQGGDHARGSTRSREALDITHLMKRKPGQMSGGQQQRVALGRALVKEPLVFLLDEPFSNLDAGLRSRMRTEVKHLHLTLGTTSVFVTHDQEEAMSLSDLIAVMRDGKVVQLGTTREIYRNPRDLYVATFVGKPKMSLVDGTLEHSDGEVAFRSAGSADPAGLAGGARPGRRGVAVGRAGRPGRGRAGHRGRGRGAGRQLRGDGRRCSSRSGRTRSWSCRRAMPRSSRGSRRTSSWRSARRFGRCRPGPGPPVRSRDGGRIIH